MNTQSNPPNESQPSSPATMLATRPFYWSVWRELWENHSIYIAPSIVAAIILFGSFVGSFHLAGRRQNALLLDPARRRAAIEMPYDIAAMMLIFTAVIIGVFYCLDALYGERRERSILFWKSLPVSDLTTVLSKASIPLVILPLFVFPVILTTQLIVLLLSTLALMGNGADLTMLWANVKFFQSSVALLYALVLIALWYAPIYGWLMLVSAWARRAAFLWAILPLIALQIFEKIAFGTKYLSLAIG